MDTFAKSGAVLRVAVADSKMEALLPYIGDAMWLGILVTVIVFFVFSLIMLWHWKEYSTGKFTTFSSIVVYLVVAGMLIACMVFGAAMLTL